MTWTLSSQEMRFLRAVTTDGVATLAELTSLGVPLSTVHHRCRPEGPWQRILPGVVLLHSGFPTVRQRMRAALAYAGPGALITGASACRLNGLRSATETTVHVLVPAPRRRQSRSFVLVERTTRVDDGARPSGLSCVRAPRAVIDAARRLSTVDDIRALLAEAVQRRRCTVTELADELARSTTWGTAGARRVLHEVSEGVRSVAEAEARTLWRRTGLPQLQWNVPLLERSGRLLATPDAWCDTVGFAWEIDSVEFHISPADYAITLARDTTLTSRGVVVLHTLPSWLRTRAAAVIGDARAAYQQAALRPRPDVMMGTRRE